MTIHQSLNDKTFTGKKKEVVRIATVVQNVNFYFSCMVENADSKTVLRWFATDNSTISQSPGNNGSQVLNLPKVRASDIKEYVCKDTASGNDARLLLTTGK